PVLRNSIAPLIETLQAFRESHYQERAQQILSVIEETQRLARSNQAAGPSISASYFAQSLRRRGVDPSWMIPRENLANPQSLNETRIFQGNTGDGSIQIPILQHSTQGTITLGLREIDSNGRIRDFYAPAGSSAGSIQSSSLLAQSARILIAAAFGVEELPTGQRVLNAQERQAGSLIRSGWIDAELDALNQELTELQQRAALIRNTPNEIELNRINTRVNAIQARFEELNRLIPNS
ncbi:MAG: hypothetical protein JNK65_08800, partial [Deltaproteobacteria bacterium]|nr:hypothetical protein [Deltaproteobacteria bacterium]